MKLARLSRRKKKWLRRNAPAAVLAFNAYGSRKAQDARLYRIFTCPSLACFRFVLNPAAEGGLPQAEGEP